MKEETAKKECESGRRGHGEEEVRGLGASMISEKELGRGKERRGIVAEKRREGLMDVSW